MNEGWAKIPSFLSPIILEGTLLQISLSLATSLAQRVPRISGARRGHLGLKKIQFSRDGGQNGPWIRLCTQMEEAWAINFLFSCPMMP